MLNDVACNMLRSFERAFSHAVQTQPPRSVLTTSLIRFSLKGRENVLFVFGSERVNLQGYLTRLPWRVADALPEQRRSGKYLLRCRLSYGPVSPDASWSRHGVHSYQRWYLSFTSGGVSAVSKRSGRVDTIQVQPTSQWPDQGAPRAATLLSRDRWPVQSDHSWTLWIHWRLLPHARCTLCWGKKTRIALPPRGLPRPMPTPKQLRYSQWNAFRGQLSLTGGK